MKSRLLLIAFVVLLVTETRAQNENLKPKKIAITVGVSNYVYAPTLKNTLNDATDMANKLRLLGFEVTILLDPSLKSFGAKIDSITRKMNSSDILLFFFSGHGAEYNGENYLFLKNSNPIIPNDMPYETYPIGKLLGRIDFAKIKTSILILDACRSNPFVRSWNKDGSSSEGLVNIEAPNGTFIGFAASPGKTASDGARKNGTYTEAILKFIELKNISIDDLFNKVNKEVRIQSEGKQIPFKNSSLEDNFYFNKDNSVYSIDENISVQSNNEFKIAPINRPVFKMPNMVKGYRNEMLNSFGLISINKTTFDRNEFIEILFTSFTENLWDRTTPFFINIYKKNETKYISVAFDEQFQPSGRKNSFRLSSSFASGSYEIIIGFYLLNEINQEYPPFYSRKFSITVL
jgi:hypothetical protein